MNDFTFYTECKECKKKQTTVGTGNLKTLLLKLRNKTEFSVLAAQVLKETGEFRRRQFVCRHAAEQKAGESIHVRLQMCDKRFLPQRNLILIFLNSSIYQSPFHENICLRGGSDAEI